MTFRNSQTYHISKSAVTTRWASLGQNSSIRSLQSRNMCTAVKNGDSNSAAVSYGY